MKVYRCDRCGKHYTHKEKTNTIDVFEVTDDEPECISSLYITTNMTSPRPQEVLDLCPDCVVSLIDWIHSGNADDGRRFSYEYTEDSVKINKIRNKIHEICKEDEENDG